MSTRSRAPVLRPRPTRWALENRQLFDAATPDAARTGIDMRHTFAGLVADPAVAAAPHDAGERMNVTTKAGTSAPPTVTPPAATMTVAEPSTLNPAGADQAALSGWSVSDDGASVTVTVTVDDTTLGSVTMPGGSGGTAVAGGVKFTGTAAQATAFVNGLTFHAADVEVGATARSTSIRVAVTDADNQTTTGVQKVSVAPSNDPATAPSTTFAVNELGPTTLTRAALDASDPEVTAGVQTTRQLVYTLTDLPAQGYLTLNGNRLGAGSVFTQADVDSGSLVYVHTATGTAQNTADGFSATLNDGATPKNRSVDVHVGLTVTPYNQPPTVSGDGSVYEGQPANAKDGSGNAVSAVGSWIHATGGGDPGDDDVTVTLAGLPNDGTLFYTGDAIVNGVAVTYGSPHAVTAADVANGFSFDYADRAGLTYANTGQLDNQGTAGAYPRDDGFKVTVTDHGGGTGTPATTSPTDITIHVMAANDDPVLSPASTLSATVADPGTTGEYHVTLTPAMLSLGDPDTPLNQISVIVPAGQQPTKGYLLLDGRRVADGAPMVFTAQDLADGRVTYVQTAAEQNTGATDPFRFQVVDNTVSPRFNTDGTPFTRVGGVWDSDQQGAALTQTTFTLHLVPRPVDDPTKPDVISYAVAHNTSTYGGVNGAAVTQGSISEGGSLDLRGDAAAAGTTYPYLEYSVIQQDGSNNGAGSKVPPDHIVYTVTGYGAHSVGNPLVERAGTMQIQDAGGAWHDIPQFGTFTQADLNSGRVRYQHDGDSEDFQQQVQFTASAGIMVGDATSGYHLDQWDTSLTFYVTPTNDAPVVQSGQTVVVAEGGTVGIAIPSLAATDPDDATSQASLEGSSTLPDGSDNYADDNGAHGSEPLRIVIDTLPQAGSLQVRDATDPSGWRTLAAGDVIDASLITGDPATTGLRYVNDGSETRSTTFDVHGLDRWGLASGQVPVAIQITNVNDPPQIPDLPTVAGAGTGPTTLNVPLTIAENGVAQITNAMLLSHDPDNSAAEVQYHVDAAPTGGELLYSTDGGTTFTTLGAGSAFTQQDVDQGRIWYRQRGGEASGATLPGTPDDRFRFTLSDGSAEQTGNEFWIYTSTPANDPPHVTGPAGPVVIAGTTAANNPVAGFSVSDPDLVTVTSGETDYVQVTVRLTDTSGTPYAVGTAGTAGTYQGTQSHLAVDAAHASLVDGTYDGNGTMLVLRGTQADVDAALANLSLTFGTDANTAARVEVIVDDRLRDASGNLSGGANGGTRNAPATSPGPTTPVPTTEHDWLTETVPAKDPNIASASVAVYASSVNEPATMAVPASTQVYEDQRGYIGTGFTFADPESTSMGLAVSVTFSVPAGHGTLGIGDSGAATSVTLANGRTVTVSGDETGTLTLTGRADDIQTLVTSGAGKGLQYTTATGRNDDQNGADPGDVTLTVSFDDRANQTGGAGIGGNTGSGSVANDPPPQTVPISIVALNDAPGVSMPSTRVYIDGPTAIPSVSVSDIDLLGDDPTNAAGDPDINTGSETNSIQAVIRLTDATGKPLTRAQYTSGTDQFTIASTAAGTSGATVSPTENGAGRALIVTGTLQQVNAYLAGLTLDAGSMDPDVPYHLEVIVDDRLRDVAGDIRTDAANGGPNPAASGAGTAPVPTTVINPYATTDTSLDGLKTNVRYASVEVFPTAVNDPATITGALTAQTETDGTTLLAGIFKPLTVGDVDAGTDTVTASVALPEGFTFSATGTDGSTITLSSDQRTATLTGTLTQVNAWLDVLQVKLPDPPAVGAVDPGAQDWNGAFDATITVHDLGNHGARPATLAAGDNATTGTFAYEDTGTGSTDAKLVTTRTVTVTVGAVNDAPVATPPKDAGGNVVPVTLPAINEDTPLASNTGATVDTLFKPYFSDARDAMDGLTGVDATGGSKADAFQGVAISAYTPDAAKGDWQYSTDGGTTWSSVGTRTDATALLLDGASKLRFVPVADYNGPAPLLTVHGVEDDANTDSTGTVPAYGSSVDLTKAGTTGGSTRISAGTVQLQTNVAAVNDPATITGALTAQTETDGTTLLAGIFKPLTVGDVDAGTDTVTVSVALPEGFTFSATGTDGSTITLSSDQRTATLTGTLTQVNAWLDVLQVKLPDPPAVGAVDPGAQDWNGAFDATITVHDLGNHGARPATLAAGDNATTGTFAYEDTGTGSTDAKLVTTRTVTVTVGAVNDAPVATPPKDAGGNVVPVTLPAINEDTPLASNTGATVDTLFKPYFSDARDAMDGLTGVDATGGSKADAFQGIAVSGYTPDATKGDWQYSTDGGATWSSVGTRTDATALLLDGASKLRFVPVADYNGPAPLLTVHGVEDDANTDSTGTVPAYGSSVDLTKAGATGGSTRISASTVQLQTDVTAVNDPATITGALTAQTETDGTTLLAGIFKPLTVGDVDAGTDTVTVSVALPQGFTFSSTGTDGSTITLSSDQRTATLTGTLTQVNAWLDVLQVKLPDPPAVGAVDPGAQDWNGAFDATITVHDLGNHGSRPATLAAGDNATTGTFAYEDTGTGSTDPKLVTTRTVTVTVGAVNDAPVATPPKDAGGNVVPVTLPAINEDTPPASIPGATVDTLFKPYFSDARDAMNGLTGVDATGGSKADAFQGVAISAYTPDATQGSWQYSTDGGRTWTDVGPRTDATALYLDASARLRFAPVADWNGVPAPLAVHGVEADANGDSTGAAPPASGGTFDLSAIGATGGSTRVSAGTVALATAVTAVNDRPVARDDSAHVSEQGPTVGGNVLTGGMTGQPAPSQADSDVDGDVLTVTGIRTGTLQAGQGTGGAIDVPLRGQYGTLVIHADGSYVYTPDSSMPAVNALHGGQFLNDVFTYTISDGSGAANSTAQAQLVIRIDGLTDGPPSVTLFGDDTGPGGSDTQAIEHVSEQGLGDPADASDTVHGHFTVHAPDELGSIDVNGTVVTAAQLAALGQTPVTIRTATGTLTLTGFDPATGQVQYDYQLAVSRDQSHGPVYDDFVIGVSDQDGTRAQALLRVRIDDAAPVPLADSAKVGSVGPGSVVTGSVTPNDRMVADATDKPVTGIAALLPGGESAGRIGAPLAGRYGTLVMQPDGSYRYQVDPSNPAVAQLDELHTLGDVFVYTVTDADGTQRTARLTIEIRGVSAYRPLGEQNWPVTLTFDTREDHQTMVPTVHVQIAVRESAAEAARIAAAHGRAVAPLYDAMTPLDGSSQWAGDAAIGAAIRSVDAQMVHATADVDDTRDARLSLEPKRRTTTLVPDRSAPVGSDGIGLSRGLLQDADDALRERLHGSAPAHGRGMPSLDEQLAATGTRDQPPLVRAARRAPHGAAAHPTAAHGNAAHAGRSEAPVHRLSESGRDSARPNHKNTKR